MGDDITIGVTEIVNNIEVTAQPNDQIIDISVIDNADDVTLNITPTVIEINVNKGSSYAKWGTILGTLSDQEDLQDALDLKADLVDGKVPSYQLPSYVDDVIEVADYASLPATGESGKIYITIDNNKIYRWTGSTYVEITDNTAVWGAITGTLSSQTDLQNALNLKADKSITITPNAPLSGGGDLSANRTLSISQSGVSSDGYLSSTDWNTFNNKQNQINGTGFVKASGTTISYDNSVYALDSVVVKLTGDQTIAGIKTFSSTVNAPIFQLAANNTIGSTPNYIGQVMADSDNWKIYGNTIEASDKGEMVFELGDNGGSFETATYGQRFRFYYYASASGTSKSPFILDYNDATFNTNATFSGNVGIGVTPSAWDSLWKVLQISKGSYFASDYGNIMAYNLYVAGEDTKYISSNRASQYEQNSGSHYWYTAPVGTAGANMTLTPRMTLDNDGNLGIGTTSPTSIGGYTALTINNNSSGSFIDLNNSSTNNCRLLSLPGGDVRLISSSQLRFDTNGEERMRINSGGATFIGTTTVSYPDQGGARFKIVNSAGATPSGYALIAGVAGVTQDGFSIYDYTNSATRLTITSGGNVGIGTTSPSGASGTALAINGGAGQTRIALKNNITGDNPADGFQILLNSSSADVMLENRENGYIAFATNNEERMRIASNGYTHIYSAYSITTGAGANVYVDSSGLLQRATSSLKYKNNVEDYTKGLDVIMQMRPVTYNSINESEEGIQYAGLIAEEIHDLGLTEFVQYADDGTPDALAYSNMVSLLVKGIQEQNVILQELKAEIELLKAK